MAVTLKDIATEVGLSHVTVSKVLRGAGGISEETRKRVFAVAERLRYRPHGLAKSMRDGRTGIVGLIYSPEGTSRALTDAQLIGIQSALADRSYELMLGMIPRAALTSRGKTSALLRSWMADGLLINHHIGLPDQVAELVEGDHVPAIWMNSKQSRNCVYFDDFGGAAAAVDYLGSLGHRRIVYSDQSHPRSWLTGNEHYSIGQRYEGYVHAMNRADLDPSAWMFEDVVVKSERVDFLCRKYLSLPESERPTAILSYGGVEDASFMATRLGLSVPRDLSVIGFGGESPVVNDLAATEVFLPHEKLGHLAVDSLMQLLASPRSALAPVSVPLSIRPGGTTAPPGST